MAIVKPFKGLRTPSQEVCEELACLPYDVMNSEEAAQMAAGKPRSLLHVTRAEIDCPAGTDIHSETVYNKSVENCLPRSCSVYLFFFEILSLVSGVFVHLSFT